MRDGWASSREWSDGGERPVVIAQQSAADRTPAAYGARGDMPMTTVDDVLRQKKDTRILTVRLRETVATALEIMQRENISALIVKDVCRTEGNVVVGIFSERDVTRALATHGAAVLNMQISAFVNRPLASCSLRDTVEEALRLMDEHHVRLLPVLEDHNLIGVISISDLIRLSTLAGIFEAAGAARMSAGEIRDQPMRPR
jgi:CBS domain-containing protein